MKRTLAILATTSALVGAYAYAHSRPSFVCDGNPVVAHHGDTLYDIVLSRCEGRFIDALDIAYQRYGVLTIGEVIVLPVREGCDINEACE